MAFYSSRTQLDRAIQQGTDDPSEFWLSKTKELLIWEEEPTIGLEGSFKEGNVTWFKDGTLNACYNALDRHLATRGDQVALIYEPNDPQESHQEITYAHLHNQICRLANVMLDLGIKKGDRVMIYMPMIPEMAYAVLACARIGAVHSVVFAGFSASALASRIENCEAKAVLTASASHRGAKTIDLQSIVQEALVQTNSIEHVICAANDSAMRLPDEFIDMERALQSANHEHECVPMRAEDPLFILYTSGSTGKPKGMLHTTGGYMTYATHTFQQVFQYEAGDVYWCTADVGWITGHSYILYGPLASGATSIVFGGIPTWPDAGRFWQLVEKHKVAQFYTAPTAIRSLAGAGDEYVTPYDLSSLKVLGTVGEPINMEAYEWYDRIVGKSKAAIVDTWFQTENGGIMMTQLPGMYTSKPTMAGQGLPGIQPVLVNENNEVLEGNPQSGNLCINAPWPSIARTIYGDHDRYMDTYFSQFPGRYFTGDGATRDEDGDYRITGRVDDVIIVSGHNLGTGPIEDAVNEHEGILESAVVGIPHNIKGNALHAFVVRSDSSTEPQIDEVNALIVKFVGPLAKLDGISTVPGLPKTRSGKIMRRILRELLGDANAHLGDTSTLLNPEIVAQLRKTL